MHLKKPYKIYYDTKLFQLKKIICEMLDVDYLEDIHLLEKYDLFKREKDQSTIWHKMYYDKFEKEFKTAYLSLVEDIKKSFGYDKIIYQKIPTFRVQLGNGNVAVGEWHKDKTYNHGTSEVNFWLPFTDTNSLNTIWMESKEDKGDYKPYYVRYGEILIFNGTNCVISTRPTLSFNTAFSSIVFLTNTDKFPLEITNIFLLLIA
jgi:hypothetical protein